MYVTHSSELPLCVTTELPLCVTTELPLCVTTELPLCELPLCVTSSECFALFRVENHHLSWQMMYVSKYKSHKIALFNSMKMSNITPISLGLSYLS